MKARFSVWEIEHNGDVDASVADLEKAGCRNVKVAEVDLNNELMVVECELPAGIASPGALRDSGRLEVACL